MHNKRGGNHAPEVKMQLWVLFTHSYLQSVDQLLSLRYDGRTTTIIKS